MKDKALNLLIKSFDQPLSGTEQNSLDRQLEISAWLREEKRRLEKLRAGIGALKKTPKAGFADQVLMALEEQQKQQDIQGVILQLFPQVAAACVAVLIVALLTTFFIEGSLSTEALVGVQDLSPEDAYTILAE